MKNKNIILASSFIILNVLACYLLPKIISSPLFYIPDTLAIVVILIYIFKSK